MKKRIIVIFLLVVALIVSLLAFTACANNSNKQVPVYQGMTITGSGSHFSYASARYRTKGAMLANFDKIDNGDNGNHNGHYKGDSSDRNDTIDEKNPYPDNNANENIEEEIKSSLNVIGSPETIYYATPNEDIYINIHIDNPDSFEIMSFTLNGKKYSSYMFEEGSDMETIILKYNVGDMVGVVEYTIDAIKYVDGTEIKDVIIEGNKTVTAGIRTENQVTASLSDINIKTNALSFNVNIKDNHSLIEYSKGICKAVIYDGDSIIAEKDIAVGDNSVVFDELKTNTLYQYAIVGYYDDLSGVGFGINILYKDAFYTDSVVLFDNITVGQESINFGYLWHEDCSNKSITNLKIYCGDTFVMNVDVNATEITGLLSNTTYDLVAEYLNLDNTESIHLNFTTIAKTVPSFKIKNDSVTTDSIDVEYDILDVDGILESYKVELYRGATLVAENTEKIISFTSLTYYTDYTLKITYTCDLNDGNGVQTLAFEKPYKTMPFIDVIECDISNTSAVSEGETIYMSVKLDNPLGMSIESVVINGETYHVASASNNKIFVEIVYNGQFTGGNTHLKIEQVNAKLDTTSVAVTPKSEFSDSVFINGKLEVLKVELVNEAFEPINWAFPSDTLYVLVELDNPTGYTIDSINDTIVNIIKIDDNRWYYNITGLQGWNSHYLSSLSYSNNYINSKRINCTDKSVGVYIVASNQIKYISTPDDLKNMSGEYYYELRNDIDLSGIEWRGNEFKGVFEGNGYSIKNMSFVGAVKEESAYLGLFSIANGVIQNLNIEEATLVATVESDNGRNYDAYGGAFAATVSKCVKIYNCSVDEYTTIIIKNTSGAAYAGGFLGYGRNRITFTNSTNNASVNSTYAAGGFLGYHGSSHLTITDCVNNGSVSGEGDVGGFIGQISGYSLTITNCTNNASINSTSAAGGFVGVAYDNEGITITTITITSSTNNGSVSGANYSDAFVVAMVQAHQLIIIDCTNNGIVE